jgi:hypothetical protein
MELNIYEFMIPTIVIICLCVGYMVKSCTVIPNKFIPTIMGVIGVVLSMWMNHWSATPEIIMTGLVSGLGSCGLYDTYKHFFEKKESEE